MMLSLAVVVIILTVVIFRFRSNKKKVNTNGLKQLPSAPGGLPVFGHLFKIGSRPFDYFTSIGYKMGPIYQIQIGWKEYIVLSNHDIMNKCLKEQGDNFAGRWQNTFTDQLAKYCGLVFKEKEWWATQRAFSLKVLKDFGFGKSQTEIVVIREMEKVVKRLRSICGTATFSADIVSLATINVMSDFIIKKEFHETDEQLRDLIRDIKKLAQGAEINTVLINIFPIFKNFPKIENLLYRALDTENVTGIIENVYKFVLDFVKDHRENFNPCNESHDLIDAFLLEQHKLKVSNVVDHSFVDFQLVRLITELLLAGFETTSTTLTWALLILSRFPNIQRKMHDEVAATIGLVRYPTMADKKSLNYSQAVMDEILRFVTLVPMSFPHKVFQDCSVDGFFIPANSVVFPNIYACHRDPAVWKKPDDFYPEHFLDDTGTYSPRPELIPFSVGKRICLGESLAKMEYFLFLVTIVQRFEFCLDPESDKKDNAVLFQGTGGIVRGAVEHQLLFKEIALHD